MTVTRAKFRVTTVTQYDNGTVTAELKAVVGGSPENSAFFKWTPSATINMTTMNLEAAQQFVPGREMYVDFTPVMSDAEIVARAAAEAADKAEWIATLTNQPRDYAEESWATQALRQGQ